MSMVPSSVPVSSVPLSVSLRPLCLPPQSHLSDERFLTIQSSDTTKAASRMWQGEVELLTIELKDAKQRKETQSLEAECASLRVQVEKHASEAAAARASSRDGCPDAQ
eukprot:gene30179-35163_t